MKWGEVSAEGVERVRVGRPRPVLGLGGVGVINCGKKPTAATAPVGLAGVEEAMVRGVDEAAAEEARVGVRGGENHDNEPPPD